MSNERPISLFKQLSRQIIPKVIAALLVFCFVLSGLFIYIAQYQLQKQHQSYGENFKNGYLSSLDNYVLAVRNLANNDLMINGLFDQRTRENFLPLLFQGLQFSNEEKVSAALFDFEGKNILSHDWRDIPSELSQNPVVQRVLSDLKPYVYIGPNGLFVVAPVVYNNMAEGAFAVYSHKIDHLFNENIQHAYQFLFDEDGALVFSNTELSLPEDFSIENIESHFANYYSLKQSSDLYTVVSIESYIHAYEHSLWILPILLFALLMAIGLSLFSSRLAANVAGLTLSELHDELSGQLVNEKIMQNKVKTAEANEIQEIRSSFTKLKEKTLSLSSSNEKIKNVINSLKEFLVVIDNDGNRMLTNTRADDFFKSSNLSFENIQHQLKIAAKEGKETVEIVSGTFTSKWRIFAMRDRSGSVIAGEDITLQLKLQEDLNIRTKAIEVATSAVAISNVVKPEQPIVYANQAFYDLTGYHQDHVIGHNYQFLLGENTTQESVQRIRYAVRQGQKLRVKLNSYRKDGSEFINEMMLTPVPNDQGAVTHFIVFQHDVTEREKNAKYLSDAKEKAEEFARIQKSFFANMNHELRTPINGIKGMLTALNNTGLTDEQLRYVSIAERSAKNLLLIVNDILEFSKAESGGIVLESTHFDLYQLLEDIREDYLLQCKEKGLQFIFKTNMDEELWVKADAMRVQQVLQNLLNNALKFTPQGSICVYTKIIDENAHLTFTCSVMDTGIGMSDSQQRKVFDAFAQASSSTSRMYGGTGLGLSICKQLINLMRGDITVESEENRGSVFSFEVELEKGEKQVVASNDKAASTNNSLSIPPVVLIAEDNEINQIVLVENLNGVKTVIAHNGVKAIEILKSAKVDFDLILMDNEMPEMDGVTTTKLIRQGKAGKKYANIPIIAVTAHAMETDRKKFLGEGMSDYMSKPIDPQILNEKIRFWTSIRRSESKKDETET